MKNHGGYILEYDKNDDLNLSFLVLSGKRENLVRLLNKGPKTLQEIKNSLNVTSSGIIPEIRKLEEKRLIQQKEREYSLTEIGEVVAESISRVERNIHVFNRDLKFWNEHRIEGIPKEFRLRLYELGNYEIIRSTTTDILRPQNEYLKILLKAKKFKGVSSVLHPQYPKYVIDLADNGVPVSLIVTRKLFKVINENFGEYLKRGINYDNANIFICDENIKFSFSVTDFFLSMRLFLKDDTYDFYQNIVSFDESAVKWGEDLFSYYEVRSKKVRSEDL